MTAYTFGWRYAEWMIAERIEGHGIPVPPHRMDQPIPDADYREMRDLGIRPDSMEYWKGYNEHIQFNMLG